MTDAGDQQVFGMDRRRFLQLCGATGLGVAVASTVRFGGSMLAPPAARAGLVGDPVDAAVDAWTYTTCQFCATGCGLYLGTRNGEPVVARGNPDYPVNQGLLCQKGLHQAGALRAPDRLSQARRRDGDELVAVDVEEALDEVVDRIAAAIDEHGPESVAIFNTGQLLQEEYYVISKLARGALGTPHLDGNPRLCMASAVVGYARSFGTDGPPNSYEDFEETDFVFLTGSNLHEAHPILGGRLMARLEQGGCTLVVADPRAIQFAQRADIYLPIRPGSDVALLNAMQHVVLDEGLIDRGYIDAHTNGFEELEALVADYPPERAADICEVPADDIRRAALGFGEAEAAMSLWTMGINQQKHGVAAVNQINNLHLITGHIGRPGAGPFSITGQPSSVDFRQAGGGPSLPGYRNIANDEHRQEIADAWGVDVGRLPSSTTPAHEIWRAAEAGDVKVLWIIGTNPAVTFPDARWAREVMRQVDTLIVQDAFHPTETTVLADILLPAAMWGEKTGTFTNSDRRVNLLRQAVDPPDQARSDFEIVTEVGRRLGHEELFDFADTEAAFDELKHVTDGRPCNLVGITFQRLEDEQGLQWPVPDESHPGTPRLYTDGVFNTEDGRAVLHAMDYQPPGEEPDDEHPFWFNNGRIQEHWHTLTKTGRIDELSRWMPEMFVEINPRDAEELGVAAGDKVRVRSPRGELTATARVTAKVAPGSLFAPMHFGELAGTQPANDLTGQFFDEFSSQPGYKQTVAAVERA